MWLCWCYFRVSLFGSWAYLSSTWPCLGSRSCVSVLVFSWLNEKSTIRNSMNMKSGLLPCLPEAPPTVHMAQEYSIGFLSCFFGSFLRPLKRSLLHGCSRQNPLLTHPQKSWPPAAELLNLLLSGHPHSLDSAPIEAQPASPPILFKLGFGFVC